jgi:hypothetical protein
VQALTDRAHCDQARGDRCRWIGVDEARSARAATPPDGAAAWEGDWTVVSARVDVWTQAAVTRTVGALAQLHPFRLGDVKSAPRLVQWVAGHWAPEAQATLDEVPEGHGLGVLMVTATDPDLDGGERPTSGTPADLLNTVLGSALGTSGFPVGSVVGTVVGSAVGSATDRLRSWSTPHRRWGGALARLPGVWLPPVALLPRAARDLDDPRTAWSTESVDFDARFAIYTRTERTTAALLTPRVMAMLLDEVPQDCAVTVSGDAVHTWWPYPPAVPSSGHAAEVVRATVRLAQALPRFVLRENPDLSAGVQAELDSRADQARRYQATRRPGHSPDPVLQRIYDEARAQVGLPPVP